jgi:predicted RND superfamily exporter protein
MNTSGIPPLRDLGNLVAVGIVFALINTLFLFPCLLLTFKPQIKHFSEWQMRLFRRYGEWLVAHPRGILVTSLLLTGAFALTSLNNQARDYFAKYYDESFQFRVANDFADAHLGGLYTLDYVIKAPTHGGITDVEYLRDLERFTDWLAQQPDVRHVASFIDIIKRMHKIMHDNTDASYRLPDSNALASQLLLAYELSLPDPQSLTQMIDISKTYSRVVVTIPSLPSDDIFRLESDINRWLTDNTQHFESTGLSGLIYVFSKIFVSSTLESLKSAAIALILIAMLLIMALRSLSLGLLSVIPNVLPFVFAFGIWGIFNGDLLLTTTAVIAITLGIVVDDTIHFLHKVQHFVQDEAMDSRTAVLRTLTEVGPAMVITTLAIGLGFFVLVFSAFLPTVHFGFVAALILFIALVLDLTILPAMLLVGERFWLRGNHAS